MQLDNTRLKHLIPIKQLQSEQRLQIAKQSQLLQLHSGDELSANEEQFWFVYLFEGKLDLLEKGCPPVLLSAEDKRALYPLFNEGEQSARVLTQTGCIIVRFEKQLFNRFIDQELLMADDGLDTVQMSEVESNLFNEIMRAYNTGKLKLPSLPDIALKVRQALASPYASAAEVARIVAVDPPMAARLISVANGPLNRAVDPIHSIQAAIVRLGVQTSKELVTSFSIKQLFVTRSKILNQRMRELYDHSIEVASISFALSKQSKKLSPDHMMLAGLLHNIGVIPILSYVEDTGLEINDVAELDRILNRLRIAVGAMVIRHWDLSDDLLEVVENYENWQRDEGDTTDTCDMVIIAQIYHRLKCHQIKDLPDINKVPAFKKLYPDNQSADFAQNVFQQAHDEIAEILQLLKM